MKQALIWMNSHNKALKITNSADQRRFNKILKANGMRDYKSWEPDRDDFDEDYPYYAFAYYISEEILIPGYTDKQHDEKNNLGACDLCRSIIDIDTLEKELG